MRCHPALRLVHEVSMHKFNENQGVLYHGMYVCALFFSSISAYIVVSIFLDVREAPIDIAVRNVCMDYMITVCKVNFYCLL